MDTIDLVDPPISRQSAPPCAIVSLGLMLLNGQLEENKMVPCIDSFLFFLFSGFFFIFIFFALN